MSGWCACSTRCSSDCTSTSVPVTRSPGALARTSCAPWRDWTIGSPTRNAVSAAMLSARKSGITAHWQPHMKGRALTLTRTLDPDAPAMRFYDLAADVQTQPEPLDVLGDRVRGPTKGLKERR